MSADNDVIISVKDLCKHYNGGEIKALDGVTTDIRKGEVVRTDEVALDIGTDEYFCIRVR